MVKINEIVKSISRDCQRLDAGIRTKQPRYLAMSYPLYIAIKEYDKHLIDNCCCSTPQMFGYPILIINSENIIYSVGIGEFYT